MWTYRFKKSIHKRETLSCQDQMTPAAMESLDPSIFCDAAP